MAKGSDERSRVPRGSRELTLAWYSQAEAARALGVTRQYVWRLVREGRLASHRRGGRLYVDGMALAWLIAERKGGRGS